MANTVPESIQAYIEALIPQREKLLGEMENEAVNNRIPVMESVSIEVMLQIMKLQNPSKILEIGTAIGYSAIRMAKTLPEAHIYTVERNEEMYKKARTFIQKARLDQQISVLFGDALDIEEKVKGSAPFDIVFIDAAKAQYERFFRMYSDSLAENGLVITDNVLFRGLVAIEAIDSKRLQKLARRIDSYNKWLAANDEYETVFYPVGDGMAVSRKRNKL